MYLLLIGEVVGLALGLIGHSAMVGAFRSGTLFLVPLVALLVLFSAADAEWLLPPRWRGRIAERRANGELRWYFCVALGAGLGIAIYPIEWIVWHKVFAGAGRVMASLAIIAGILTVAVSTFVGWYWLTKYPKGKAY